jgi:hypothetical protein
MRSILIALLIACAIAGCNSGPSTTTSSTKDVEREHPDAYLKVNYEVRRNLVGKKVIEGEVINTGKYMTFKTVTLKIESIRDGDETSVNYTIPDAVAPGAKQEFKYKPEGNPDKVKVSIASASAD